MKSIVKSIRNSEKHLPFFGTFISFLSLIVMAFSSYFTYQLSQQVKSNSELSDPLRYRVDFVKPVGTEKIRLGERVYEGGKHFPQISASSGFVRKVTSVLLDDDYKIWFVSTYTPKMESKDNYILYKSVNIKHLYKDKKGNVYGSVYFIIEGGSGDKQLEMILYSSIDGELSQRSYSETDTLNKYNHSIDETERKIFEDFYNFRNFLKQKGFISK